jgi:hypothetical protein
MLSHSLMKDSLPPYMSDLHSTSQIMRLFKTSKKYEHSFGGVVAISSFCCRCVLGEVMY